VSEEEFINILVHSKEIVSILKPNSKCLKNDFNSAVESMSIDATVVLTIYEESISHLLKAIDLISQLNILKTQIESFSHLPSIEFNGTKIQYEVR
jgi:hypothetical protein